MKPIDFGDFEAAAIALKEDETELLRTKTLLAHWAVNGGARRYLAELWACSSQTINRLAAMFNVFSTDEIRPDVPLSLYGAVMETDAPSAWLERALAEGLSARDVRDRADILKGKHLSRCQFAGEVEVLEWDVTTGHFAVTGLPISGDKPSGLARVTVREVLEKGE